MRPTEFIYGLVEKFAPMSEKSAVDLRSDAMASYNMAEMEAQEIAEIEKHNRSIRYRLDNEELDKDKREALENQLKEVPKKKIQHQLVVLGENWMVRTILAFLFIYITPKIQEYLNPKPDQGYADDDDDFED